MSHATVSTLWGYSTTRVQCSYHAAGKKCLRGYDLVRLFFRGYNNKGLATIYPYFCPSSKVAFQHHLAVSMPRCYGLTVFYDHAYKGGGSICKLCKTMTDLLFRPSSTKGEVWWNVSKVISAAAPQLGADHVSMY